MAKRNSPKDITAIDDLNRLNFIVNDKRLAKRANEKKTRRNRHYEKQFIKNTFQDKLLNNPIMTKEAILLELQQIIKPYMNANISSELITETSDFIADLKINSANLVDIILDIEDHFGIVIDQQSMEAMLDVKSTLEIIETKLIEKK